MNPESTVQ